MDIFDEKTLQQLFRLRTFGWSPNALSFKYNVPENLIKEILDANKITVKRRSPFKSEFKQSFDNPPPKEPPKESKYEHLFREVRNQGKTYQEYVRDSEQRKYDRNH